MLLPRKWALSLGLLAAAPSLSVAGPFDFAKPAVATQQAERGNQEVAEDIASALSKERLVHKNVQIEYKAGMATISGEIKDAAQRALVSKVVGQIAGVSVVENKLTVMEAAAPRSDNPFAQAAAEAPADARTVQQAVQEGTPSRQVRPVNFNSPEGMNNQKVAQDIADALTNAGLSGYDIEVRYKNGTASLLGNVEDSEQVARAYRATQSVAGVNQILNRLTAKGQPVDIRQTAMQTQGPPAGYRPGPPQGYPQGYPQGSPQRRPPIQQTQGYAPGMGPMGQPGMGPGALPPGYGHTQPVGHQIYNQANMPEHAWPSYAQYDNYAAVTYPSQYDASAWPYIGPYYPYPQVPMGWRSSTLEWDDGYWNLKFESRTDKWWWFLNPKNWD